MEHSIPVLPIPYLDPGMRAPQVQVPAGSTIDEIVKVALPGALPSDLDCIRVIIGNENGTQIVSREYWRSVRPKLGTHVIVRVVPGKNSLRSVLQVVVAVAAVAVATAFSGPIGGSVIAGKIFGSVLALGVSVIGNLAINALIPPQISDAAVSGSGSSQSSEVLSTVSQAPGSGKGAYSISGWKNSASPNGLIPFPMGELRVAPPFAAPSFSEIVGDDLYIRSFFAVGYGELEILDHRIGETSIAEFDDVEIEVKYGTGADTSMSLFPYQVIEENHGVELRYEPARDDYGQYTGSPVFTPVTRLTSDGVNHITVILGFPQGLVEYDENGNEQLVTVDVRVVVVDGSSTIVSNITHQISGSRRDGFYRSVSVDLPSTDVYKVEVGRLSQNADSSRVADVVQLVAIQGRRPEYPINFGSPLAMVGVRVKASRQLNSSLDNYNCKVRRRCYDYDSGSDTWVYRTTSNPASLFRLVLQHDANPNPVPDSEIDLEKLAEWHVYCDQKGLRYNRNHGFRASVEDVLGSVAAAGRASPRHDGLKYTVVIDKPQSLVIDHLDDQNARQFNWERAYLEIPDGFRVPFLDEENDYKPAERIVPWPGFTGTVRKAEELQLPGVTSAGSVWIEARRRQFETIYRPDTFTCTQDGAARVATRGDRVAASFNGLAQTLQSYRVIWVEDSVIQIDGEVTMQAGTAYSIRYFAIPESGTPFSVLEDVTTIEGASSVLRITSPEIPPVVGTIVHFGITGQVSEDLIVRNVESGQDMTSIVKCVALAPEIDQLTDLEVPPAWDGSVGESAPQSTLAPSAPVVTLLKTLPDFTGFQVILRPGSGSSTGVLEYEIDHKLVAAGSYTTVVVLASESGVSVGGYSGGESLNIRFRAKGVNGVYSAYSNILTFTLDSANTPPPAVDGASGVGGLGRAALSMTSPGSDLFAMFEVYRGSTATFASMAKIQSIPSQASTTVAYVDGDASIVSQITNGEFAVDTDWTKGTGWSIGAGAASKSSGSASSLSQAQTFSTGETYRFGLTVSSRTAGSVKVRLSGGSDVDGSDINTNDSHFGLLIAVSGNDTVELVADADFDGTIDSFVMFAETPQCAPQGVTYYGITAANSNGDESSALVIGPYNII
ncbi:MAG: phage tail protein [Pseudomonadota bacterium]